LNAATKQGALSAETYWLLPNEYKVAACDASGTSAYAGPSEYAESPIALAFKRVSVSIDSVARQPVPVHCFWKELGPSQREPMIRLLADIGVYYFSYPI